MRYLWSAMGRSPKRLAVSMLLLMIGPVPAFAQPISVLERRGEAVLSRECGMCHAIGRFGDSPRRGAPSFLDIARRGEPARLKQSLETGTIMGHPTMPNISLNGTDIEAILAYLAAIREP